MEENHNMVQSRQCLQCPHLPSRASVLAGRPPGVALMGWVLLELMDSFIYSLIHSKHTYLQ